MTAKFRVGLTRDILDSRGDPAFGKAALEILDHATTISWEYLPEVVSAIAADHAATYDALYVNLPRVPAAAVARADCRLHAKFNILRIRIRASCRAGSAGALFRFHGVCRAGD